MNRSFFSNIALDSGETSNRVGDSPTKVFGVERLEYSLMIQVAYSTHYKATHDGSMPSRPPHVSCPTIGQLSV